MPLRKRDGMWHYRFWVDGHEYTKSTDLAATERNRNAAARKEAKDRELVITGRAHELKLEVKSFNDAAREFLQWARGEYTAHPATARRLDVSFASLKKFFGKRPVSIVLSGHVNDYKSWRRSEHGVREVTIRHDLHALSKAYRYFISHNWARANPVKREDIPSDKDAVRMHVLTAAEEMLYFAAAGEGSALYDSGRLILNQGCRPDEILQLRPDDVDLERGRVSIRDGKSRAARRHLKLTTESREICVRRLSLGEPWLFPGKRPGSRLTKLNGVHGRILDALAVCKCGHRSQEHEDGKCRCGCAEFREASRLAFVMYDFRHTFATRAAEAGMPVASLAAILGHSDLRSVMRYVHVRQDAQDRAMLDFERTTIAAAAEQEKKLVAKSAETLQ